MNILVCIKPDMAGREIGPFEHLALEAALVLKAAWGETGMAPARVDVVTVGPDSWKDCLYRALGTGADQAYHLVCPADSDWPGLRPAGQTATILARALSAMPGYDLILTGILSQDLMAGQTGPLLAQHLGLPWATAVVRLDLVRPKKLTARREMDQGVMEDLDIPLPALVSIQSGYYTPRYPILSHMLRAREKPFHSLVPESVTALETFLDPMLPEKTRQARMVRGPVQDQVAAFKAFLRERGLS